MTRIGFTVALAFSLAANLSAQEAKRDNPLPEALLKAWTKAGAEVGWMGPDRLDRPEFRFGKKGKEDEVPAFLFYEWVPGRIRKLPQPKQAFGLFLGAATMKDAKTGTSVPIGDDELKELAGLKTLQSLSLSFSRVTDAGLADLARLKSLQALNLGFTKVTDTGMKELAGLKLQALALTGTAVGSLGVRELAEMTSLKALDVSGSSFSENGLKDLAGLKALKALNLASTEVSDDAVEVLASLTPLETLDVSDTKITVKGLAELSKALPKAKISR